MIARVQPNDSAAWQHGFLKLLPSIRRFASIAFRSFDPAAREEAVAEAVAAAMVAYRRLVEQGRHEIAYASPLARYAVLHALAGRHVGGRLNHTDVMSRSAQRRHGFQVASLNQPERPSGRWVEHLVTEDRRATPAEVASTRLDFRSWLETLTSRQQLIAQALESGDTTGGTARQFGVTASRISQMRRELDESWSRYQAQAAVA